MPALQERIADLERLDTQVLGVSVDSVPCHEAWAKSLGGVAFPLLSDIHRRVCQAYGILIEDRNIAERAVFLIDRQGIVRFARVYGAKELPDFYEVLGLLEQMREGGS